MKCIDVALEDNAKSNNNYFLNNRNNKNDRSNRNRKL